MRDENWYTTTNSLYNVVHKLNIDLSRLDRMLRAGNARIVKRAGRTHVQFRRGTVLVQPK